MFSFTCSTLALSPTLPTFTGKCIEGVYCLRKLNALIERALTGTTDVLIQYQRRVEIIFNGMQIFLLFLYPCLIAFLGTFVLKLMTCDSIVLMLALSPVTLFHLLLYNLQWVSFVQTLILMGTFGIISQQYAFIFFRQNHVKLIRILTLVTRSRYISLKCALQQNLRLFEEFFIGNAFFGPMLTVYLAVHLPASAYFSTVIAFGQVDGLMRMTLIGLVMETINGSLFVHLSAAYFSSYVHKSGKVLLSFNAKGSVTKSKLPVRFKLILFFFHIQRLVVREKYGITYSIGK